MSTQAIIVVDNLNEVPREHLASFIAAQLTCVAGLIKMGKGTKEINDLMVKMRPGILAETMQHIPETSVSLPYLTQGDM